MHLCFLCPFVIDTFTHLHEDYNWPNIPNIPQVTNLFFRQAINYCHSVMTKENMALLSIGWWFIGTLGTKLFLTRRLFLIYKLLQLSIISFFQDGLRRIYSETQDSSLNGIGHSSKFSKMPRSGQNVIWSPPPLNLCKLNFDGSKIRNSSSSFDLSFEMKMAQ